MVILTYIIAQDWHNVIICAIFVSDRRIRPMFVETLKASVVVKSLATLLIGVITAFLIKRAVEDQVPGDNYPHVFISR